MIDFKATLKSAHRNLTLWYGYFVAGLLTVQASWDQLDDYIPSKWRHLTLGVLTGILIVDKIRRNVVKTDAIKP